MRTAILAILILAASSRAHADERDEAIEKAVRESQVTLQIDREARRSRFQATVVARDGDVITVLTAGHGLGPADSGADLMIGRGEKAARARVEAVARNPNYRPPPSGDIPGADNALARLRIEPDGTLPAVALRPVELARFAIPEPAGRTLTVRSMDQFGAAHVMKAGNYSNPRWLEWGPSYSPVAGDSGGGVFVVRERADGTIGPVVVAVVVDRGERGGGASILHRKDRWVAAALKAPDKAGR